MRHRALVVEGADELALRSEGGELGAGAGELGFLRVVSDVFAPEVVTPVGGLFYRAKLRVWESPSEGFHVQWGEGGVTCVGIAERGCESGRAVL